jgi:hypothetical protein
LDAIVSIALNHRTQGDRYVITNFEEIRFMFGSSFTGTSLHLSTPASLILAFVASTYLQASPTLQARTLDPNGADFRDAKIRLYSRENGLGRIAKTPEEDIYQVAPLPVGSSVSQSVAPANQSGTQGSIVQFRESSFWELYHWRIVAIVSLLLVETLLIAGFLIQRSKRARAEESRRLSEANMRKLTGRLIHLQEEERRGNGR